MAHRLFFDDDDAVSPVIGVILMVAITVILAAVIGAFVLGIGNDPAAAPQASWDIDQNTNSSGVGNVTFEHTGGDAVRTDDLTVVVGNERESVPDGETLQIGKEVTVEFGGANDIESGEEVRLVWSDGSSEQTIATHRLTEATNGEDIDSVDLT